MTLAAHLPSLPARRRPRLGVKRRAFLVTMTALATWIVLIRAAFAGEVALRPDIADADGRVTLGELFDGAGSAGDIVIANRAGASVVLDAGAVQLAARRAGLDWANAEGLRQIVVRGGASTGAATPAAARGNVDVLTWARNIATGEIVQPQDLVWGQAALAPADAPNDPDVMVGQAARRALRAGAAVSGHDVSAVQVVKANEMVTLTYDSGGVSLALQAKALTGGAVGEMISVQNVTSKKTV